MLGEGEAQGEGRGGVGEGEAQGEGSVCLPGSIERVASRRGKGAPAGQVGVEPEGQRHQDDESQESHQLGQIGMRRGLNRDDEGFRDEAGVRQG